MNDSTKFWVTTGLIVGAYVYGKLNGSLKTLECVNKEYGHLFPQNTEVKINFGKRLCTSKIFNETK